MDVERIKFHGYHCFCCLYVKDKEPQQQKGKTVCGKQGMGNLMFLLPHTARLKVTCDSPRS